MLAKKLRIPEKLSIVRCRIAKELIKQYGYPFCENGLYVFLGEIVGMPGHCVVAEYPNGEVFSGYHTDNFTKLKLSEL